jgi:hypothetical protein
MFIQIIQGRCRDESEVQQALDRWRTECEPGADGWLGGTYGVTDDGTFIGVVRFASEEAAMRNSARPEQARWWEETRQLFDGPIEFHDCRDVTVVLDSDAEEAGFVQIVRGRIDDPERLRTLMESLGGTLHEERPEITWATLAIEDDGTFTETVAFTDEATARANERAGMPEEMQELMDEGHLQDLQFMDLHRPWFAGHGSDR